MARKRRFIGICHECRPALEAEGRFITRARDGQFFAWWDGVPVTKVHVSPSHALKCVRCGRRTRNVWRLEGQG